MRTPVKHFCECLGYDGDSGLIEPREFSQVTGVAQALWAAHDQAKLQACFGAWEDHWGQDGSRRFTPLVYIVQADDEDDARRIHRWVWSQGKVPCLVILCPDEVIVCSGFHFLTDARWNDAVQREPLPWSTGDRLAPSLRDLAPDRLHASITWRDFTKSGKVGVDAALLDGLEGLHDYLADNIKSERLRIRPDLINRLIGRLIYTYLLTDKRVIEVEGWECDAAEGERLLEQQSSRFWTLQDRIDEVFNGGVFQISEQERSLVTPSLLDLAIGFIRRGEKYDGKYRQTALFSIDLSAIRIETLSAVYEKFLRTESVEDANRDGVVYTRPFLADFILNRVADSCKFKRDTKVLDPTCGSGVFLVAAFRHIVESELAVGRQRGRRYLSLQRLHELLKGCIYGVEKSSSAAQVAAFSLYLNLLDYLDPVDLASHINEVSAEKVFPPMLGSNIVAADFFSKKRFFPEISFDITVGNPPWKKLADVTEHSGEVERYAIEWHDASQHVAWSLVKKYLKVDGRLALVLPAKSFAAPAAGRFVTAFARETDIDLVVNMSSWRRYLFAGAEDPAALMFATNRPPKAVGRTYFYMPRLWSQPFNPDAMWMLAVDRADVNSLPSAMAFANPENVFDAFVLKPYDRRVKQRLISLYHGEKVTSLRGLLDDAGLELARGVTAAELKIPGAARAAAAQLDPKLRDDRRSVITDLSAVFEEHPDLRDLSIEQLKENSVGARCKGPRLILARSMQYCYRTAEVFAVNPTFNLIFSIKPTPKRDEARQLELLSRLGQYLMSDFARYQFALFGKLWQIDGKRAEKNDLERIVVPSLASLQSHTDWDCSGSKASDVLKRMEMEEFLAPLEDYADFRSELENARWPTPRPSGDSRVPETYLAMLGDVLCSRLNEEVEVTTGEGNSVMTEIVLGFQSDLEDTAIAALSDGDGFQFFDSARLKRGSGRSQVIMCKPKGVEHMTLERAYADGLHVINRLFLR
ncbi:HsdM family class I SAM-dependent methyltransferase [Pandoraea terrigena]|uniref:site-specific DNA-methyltransferase (adenine-specific) n=1 Tax=Pandoraea terrigena TaxID=2508292 RepID=A0A5E4W740_9BURK|nr:N-6 DNA methylase [Pandoraea terrigena]VVE20231.1 SAM-dependent methyltransferase [Pandoraea terrigena]